MLNWLSHSDIPPPTSFLFSLPTQHQPENARYALPPNPVRFSASSEPSSSFLTSTTSNESIPKDFPFHTQHFPLPVPPFESLPNASDGGWPPCSSKLRIDSLCAFSWRWSPFLSSLPIPLLLASMAQGKQVSGGILLLIQILQQAGAKSHTTLLCSFVENSAFGSLGNYFQMPCTKHQLEVNEIIFQMREAESLTLLLESKYLTTGSNGSLRPCTALQRV